MNSVLLDTSFFIRMFNPQDPLYKNAIGYFKYFISNDFIMKISTISIAEYCVKGKIEELPLDKMQVVSFNVLHAKVTGKFANAIFKANKKLSDKIQPRILIPNDSKLFAQADTDDSIKYFVTSDARSKQSYMALSRFEKPHFEILDINIPYTSSFGVLDIFS